MEPAAVINVKERVPIALLLINPKADVAGTSISEVLQTVSQVLDRHTNFSVDVIDPQDVMTFCEGRLGCIVRRVRKDYERDRLLAADGSPMPYDEHLKALGNRPYTRYLVILSNVAQQGRPDRLSSLLVDTDEALAEWHEADQQRRDWQRDVESRINSSAVVARPKWAELSNAQQTQAYLQRLFRDDFHGVFARSGNWHPYGSVAIRTNLEGLSIQLDGRLVGSTREGVTRLEGVTAGGRTVLLSHPEFDPFTRDIVVEAGSTQGIDATVQTRSMSGGRVGVLWSGVGIAAVGAVFVGLALEQDASSLKIVCVRSNKSASGSCGTEGRSEFTSLSGADGDDPNGAGVLTAPLGYSLMASGAAFSLGSLLSPSDTEIPWLAIGAGLVVGALSYGISHALNGKSAYKTVEP